MTTSSFKRFNTNKAVFVSRLLKAWEKAPELSLFELLTKAMAAYGTPGVPMPDEELIAAVERLVLLTEV